jgi:hypothetical protein
VGGASLALRERFAGVGVEVAGGAAVGDAVAAVSFAFRERFAGVGVEVAVDLAVGDAVAVGAGSFAFRERLAGVGVEVAAGVAVGDVAFVEVASFFLDCFCLATLGDAFELGVGVGVLPTTNTAAEKTASAITSGVSFFIAYEASEDGQGPQGASLGHKGPSGNCYRLSVIWGGSRRTEVGGQIGYRLSDVGTKVESRK